MTLLQDLRRHEFAGYFGCPSQCRIRIFAPTEASGGLPVVVATEVPNNPGTSVTNMAEQLAADVLVHYLPRQDGLDPPFLWVEHYPDDCFRADYLHAHGRHEDSYSQERFSRVAFSHTNPEQRRVWALRLELRFGTPEWEPLPVAELERLIGEAWQPEFETEYPQPEPAHA